MVRPQSKSQCKNVDLDANMDAIRLARPLGGTRKATRLIVSSSRILICEDCLLSNGTGLMAAFDFLFMDAEWGIRVLGRLRVLMILKLQAIDSLHSNGGLLRMI